MSANHEIVFSFGVDNGELDGLSPQQVFVLGYELCRVYEAAERGDELDISVRAENCDRIERACKKFGRTFSLTWVAGDVSEEWMRLRLQGSETA